MYLVGVEEAEVAQPTLQEADVPGAEVEDVDTEEQRQAAVHGQTAVHTHDNNNNNSPNTLSDHSNHAVVAEGGDMVLEQEAVFVAEVVEEYWLLFPSVLFHPSLSFPSVAHWF